MDDVIYEWGTDEIIEELQSKNEWIGDEIDSIYKFPTSNTIKITFRSTQLAKKCTEQGLRAFGISVPSHEIRQETYISIQCCMRCYKLEHHNIRDCPEDTNFKRCSECSTEGHLWYQCKEKKTKKMH